MDTTPDTSLATTNLVLGRPTQLAPIAAAHTAPGTAGPLGWVTLGGGGAQVHVHATPAQAREAAQAFLDLAERLEQAQ